MRIRIHIIRYLLVAAAWLLSLISLRLPGGRLNGFLRWQGECQTWFFIRWMIRLPWHVISDVSHGWPVFWMDTAWMLIMLLGLILLLAAPIIVYRTRTPAMQTIIRCLAPTMLLLPVTLCLPESYRFPIPGPGLWCLGSAHVLCFVALALSEKTPDAAGAFPVTPRPS